MMMYGYHGAGWGMGLGWIFMLVLWGFALYGVVTLIRRSAHGTGGESALDILNKRFARGEIDQEEYERRRRAIER
ncbi:MAG: SHOCT domain-containing protein [Paludibacterium sp.]|uniref:SHOCT domain-containing protein n=1 Tax=Paludibacterium sp. TaxID=1917523 RepID=UPI0025E376FC|nr:SHOCT domain-containing protein [Paludibacterium sp.]MBV8046717.1 SHOCT domain-containing protein [Paludibacterium sp.]MBV8646808.1 SHOCT domain-containing protein [Paludibacterium sp.]